MAELVLTKEQQAVVENRGGTLLVSAAAGSGKTKVLVDRVLARVAEPSENCNVDDFLMITFTQAAAAELRGKLIAALSERLAQQPEHRHLQRQMSRVYLAQISTVHAFCSTLLREYAHVLELPSDFRVCDEQEAIRLRQRAMQSVLETAYSNLEPGSELAAALDMLGAGRDDRALAELIEKVYSAMQCFRAPDERLMECRSMLDVSAYTDVGQTIWGQYLLRELRGYLDDCLSSLQDARTLIETTEALQPYYPTILENIETVKQLAGAVSWEEIRTAAPDFGRLNAIRKCPEPEKQKKVQMLRKRVVDGLRRRLGKFALPSEELLQDLQLSGKALRGLLLLTERFSDAYRKEKLRRHALDYNDLEHETLRLLLTRQGQPTAEAREVSKRYTEIMVDEYQDTNDVQDAIFNAISRNGQNLFFVGDVKQSIYRFRLADPTIFLEKYKSFAPYTAAKPGQPRKILLSDNFRSHPEILDAANAVFRLTMTERDGGLRGVCGVVGVEAGARVQYGQHVDVVEALKAQLAQLAQRGAQVLLQRHRRADVVHAPAAPAGLVHGQRAGLELDDVALVPAVRDAVGVRAVGVAGDAVAQRLAVCDQFAQAFLAAQRLLHGEHLRPSAVVTFDVPSDKHKFSLFNANLAEGIDKLLYLVKGYF